MEVSWIELAKLLDRVEEKTAPKVIKIKRQHIRDDKYGYDFTVKTHYRYKDLSILTASVMGREDAKH